MKAHFNFLLKKSLFCFARFKQNSDWIYSSKSQEMLHAHKGRLYIFSHPGPDIFNCSLRVHKAVQSSQIVLAQNIAQTRQLLQSLSKKIRTIKRQSHDDTQDNSSEIQLKQTENPLIVSKKQEMKQKQFQFSYELSKQLQMSLQIQKINQSNNDRQNRNLKQSQEDLMRYMQVAATKQKLQKFKQENGHPYVVGLEDHIQKLLQLRAGGVDILCVVKEESCSQTRTLFEFLEKNDLPYEILPVKNHLINMLALSGFPADRFTIEYFPRDLKSLFSQRKPMKMTVALMIRADQLQQAIQQIQNIYGGDQMIFLIDQNDRVLYRGEAYQFKNIKQMGKSGKGMLRLAVSPYLQVFNENLKEQKQKVSRLYGQGMSAQTHFVRMEILNKQLSNLKKRKEEKQIEINLLIHELFRNKIPENRIEQVLSELLSLEKDESKQYIKGYKQQLIEDNIGLSSMMRS